MMTGNHVYTGATLGKLFNMSEHLYLNDSVNEYIIGLKLNSSHTPNYTNEIY